MELNRHTLNAQPLGVASESAKLVAEHRGTFSLRARVGAEHHALFGVGIWIGALHTALFSLRVRVPAQDAALFSLNVRVPAQHSAPFVIGPKTPAQHEGLWGLRVLAYHTAPYGNRIEPVWHTAPYLIYGRVLSAHAAPSAILSVQPVAAQHVGPWAQRFSAEHTALWQSTRRTLAAHTAAWSYSVPAAAQHVAALDILAFVPITAQHRTFYDVAANVVFNITGTPHVEKGGQQVAIASADLAFDEGGFAWTANLELTHVGDYQRFKRNDRFTVVLFGDRYELMVDSKSLSRDQPTGVTMVISGVSPTATLDSGPDRAAELTKTWTEPVNASAVVQELAGDIAVDWRVLDWLIPAHRLGVSGASPIAVIRQIAEAVGGVAESTQEGSLLIRPTFPVSVPDWDTATPDQVVTDNADTLSVREGVIAAAVFDKFYLSDVVDATSRDRVEWAFDEGATHKGQLLVYPAIWRTNLAVTSTRTGMVLSPMGVVSREEEETVEFAQGISQTGYPIDAILETEWLDRHLGGVSAGAYSSQLTATGEAHTDKYSLLRIRYRTKALVYTAEYTADGAAQFLVEEF